MFVSHRQRSIFRRRHNPWPARMKALAIAGMAAAVVISFKTAMANFEEYQGVDPRGVRLGSTALAAQAD